MNPVPPARHLLRAKDLVDARYREPLDVDDLAAAARLSKAHFSREFRRAFGESPHQYLLTRRRRPGPSSPPASCAHAPGRDTAHLEKTAARARRSLDRMIKLTNFNVWV